MDVTYGEFTIDTDKVATAGLSALLSRGLAHILGNEASSKVVSQLRVAALGDSELKGEARTAALKAIKVDPDSAEYKAAKATIQAEMLSAIIAGTIGESERGPRVSPFDAEVAAIVKREVLAKLVANGLWKGRKNPTDEQTWTLSDTTLTFADMLTRHLAKNEARIHKEANAKIDAEARKVKKAAEDAAKLGDGPKSAEALGL
jgi:hypothetical protein